MTLAKAGLYGGNPQTVLGASVDLVMQSYWYEIFTREYENTFIELNSKEVK